MSLPVSHIEALLKAEWYTPEELAELFEVTPNTVRTAVYENRLQARVLDGHILQIRRDDALAWLKMRLSSSD